MFTDIKSLYYTYYKTIILWHLNIFNFIHKSYLNKAGKINKPILTTKISIYWLKLIINTVEILA